MEGIAFEVTSEFKKEFKRLLKKYPSLEKDIRELKNTLIDNPLEGVPLSGGFRKIRMAITSKGKGKSGGARVITFNYFVDQSVNKIVFVIIYDKSEHESITENELRKIFSVM